MNREYTAIHELDRKLTAAGIPHTMGRLFEGWQICVPAHRHSYDSEGDAIQHQFSYGNDKDLIEIWGFGLKEPAGFLTVDEALEFFVKWHEKQEKKKNGKGKR